MKKLEYCFALVALIGLIGFGCQSPPDDAATNEPVATAPAGEPAATEVAAPATEEAPRITADQLADVFANTDVFLLDVRRPEELEEFGTVESYTNIPIEELEGRLDELPRDRPILTA